MMTPDLSVQLGNTLLKNPILTASGCFGYGLELEELIDINQLGGIVSKSLTLQKRIGTPPRRLVETASGLINAIGLENIGVDAFLYEKLPRLEQYNTAVFANIMGNAVEDYGMVAAKFRGNQKIAGIEINISSPNTKKGGMHFGVDPEMTYQVVRAVKDNTDRPVIAKLSPNVTDIVHIARRAVDAGADMISLINTLWSLAIDSDTGKPLIGNITGGLSGPAIKPVALRMVWQVAKEIPKPIIGIGGIASLQDVLEFLRAGASAVQIGTANFYEPTITMRLIRELREYCEQRKIEQVRSLIGKFA
ncbi:MAG: dihydroorotate dehydrogenase [Acidobacteria bacterium]|nr:MAG: dihydroorotate dehydrogenase [Acidobacteriota bacterium]